MTRLKSRFTLAAAVALVGTWPLLASAQTSQDPHHPANGASAQAATPAPQTGPGMMSGSQGMMGGSGMMGGAQGMMGSGVMGGSSMTDMMGLQGRGGPGMWGASPCGPGMAGAATIDHVEGRIAFLRTELKITEAQTSAWNAFADALRTNAKKLGEVRASMMPRASQSQALTLATLLDAQEKWLTARLEGTRAMRSAFTKLYDTLSPEQKKTADELLAPHMGMGPMAMGANVMMQRGGAQQ